MGLLELVEGALLRMLFKCGWRKIRGLEGGMEGVGGFAFSEAFVQGAGHPSGRLRFKTRS